MQLKIELSFNKSDKKAKVVCRIIGWDYLMLDLEVFRKVLGAIFTTTQKLQQSAEIKQNKWKFKIMVKAKVGVVWNEE